MKQHLSNALRGFVCALAFGSLGSLIIALMLALYDMPRTAVLAVLPWAALLLALSLVLEWIAAKDGSLLLYLAACCLIVGFGAEAVVSRTQFIPASSGFPVLLRLIIYASGAACAWAIHKLPPSDVFVRLGDVLIITLACNLALCFSLGDALIPTIIAPSLAALCACLVTAALLRAGGEGERVVSGAGTGFMLILTALLGGCLLLAGGLLGVVSGRINGIVDLLLTIWNAVLRLFARALELFARFIALFAPRPVSYSAAPVQEDSLALSANGIEVAGKMPAWVITLFIVLLALLVVAAVLGILWMLRGTKLSRSARRKKSRRVTRTSRMLEALLERIRALRDAVGFELLYRRHRRTPQGLYVLAVRVCRLTRRKKRPSESPGAFIRRLHAELLDASGLSTLDALADKLDRALYAGEAVPLSHGESDAFAAQLQALRRCPTNKPVSS